MKVDKNKRYKEDGSMVILKDGDDDMLLKEDKEQDNEDDIDDYNDERFKG